MRQPRSKKVASILSPRTCDGERNLTSGTLESCILVRLLGHCALVGTVSTERVEVAVDTPVAQPCSTPRYNQIQMISKDSGNSGDGVFLFRLGLHRNDGRQVLADCPRNSNLSSWKRNCWSISIKEISVYRSIIKLSAKVKWRPTGRSFGKTAEGVHIPKPETPDNC